MVDGSFDLVSRILLIASSKCGVDDSKKSAVEVQLGILSDPSTACFGVRGYD